MVRYVFLCDKKLILVKMKILYRKMMNYLLSIISALVQKSLPDPI